MAVSSCLAHEHYKDYNITFCNISCYRVPFFLKKCCLTLMHKAVDVLDHCEYSLFVGFAMVTVTIIMTS